MTDFEPILDSLLRYYHEATPEEVAKGRCWYKNAHGEAMSIMAMSHSGFQMDGWAFSQACAIISALSPSNKWERNINDAYSMARWHAKGNEGPPPSVCTYNSNKAKALNIAGQLADPHRDFSEMLGGLKTRAFARLIERPGLLGTVVIDRHAIRAYLGCLDTPSVSNRLYREAEYAYIKAADSMPEEHLTPAELQAIVWLAFKRVNGV